MAREHRLEGVCALFGAAALLAASPATAADGQAPAPKATSGAYVGVVLRASGFVSPVGVTGAGDGTNRLFVVEQGGRVRIWDGTQILPTPFLDLSSLVVAGGEQGLLGLAFHPSYETNGYFFVNYTRKADGDTVVARYEVSSANPNVADPASERILFVLDQPFTNHNAGNLAFGPDGYLYIGFGDGGSGDDTLEVAQDLTRRAGNQAFLGKMLRIDVDQNVGTAPYYGIPPSNPYTTAGDPTDAIPDEIWARGLRNPWRYSFDRSTGDLYVGDVGQSTREEVSFLAAGTAGGANFGWDVLEGTFCHEDVPSGSCAALLVPGASVLPILEYGRGEGSTVIGGYVFRGRPTSTLLSGAYVFADLGSGSMWRASADASGTWTKQLLFPTSFGPASFGEGDGGGLFVVGLYDGGLYQVTPYTFQDVPPSSSAWSYVESIFEAGVTSGCGASTFCPGSSTTRAQMAVFLLRSRFGSSYTPPACTTASFSDVPCTHPFASWIYDIAARGITVGCGGGRFCPDSVVSRQQMSVFLLRTLDPALTPPACGTPVFADVPASSGFCPWIEEIARRGITAGCGGSSFCPSAPVTRAQTAVFLVRTFGLLPI
jgi:glucose/arabinose dehydrogenase